MPKLADLLEQAAVDKLAALRMELGQHQAPAPGRRKPRGAGAPASTAETAATEPPPVVFRDGTAP